MINSTNSPASGTGNISETTMTSQVGRVREFVCAWISVIFFAIRAAEVPTYDWGRRTTRAESRPANDGDSEAEAQRHTFLISDLEKSDQIHTPIFLTHRNHPESPDK